MPLLEDAQSGRAAIAVIIRRAHESVRGVAPRRRFDCLQNSKENDRVGIG
jgi:hypothetical protein